MPHQSAINGAKGTGNPNPRYDHLNNQPNGFRGRSRGEVQTLRAYAFDRGAITSMSETPAIDFLRACAANESLRHDLRISAAGYVAKYEAHPKAPKPYVPKIPEGYTLPRLETTADCQEALRILAEDQLTGKIDLDAAERLRRHIEVLLPSLEVSEVREKLAEFAALVEQVEAQKTIEHEPVPQADK